MDKERNSVATRTWLVGPIFEYCDFWILRDNGVKMAAALWKLIYASLKWQCEN
jgi:hypothetical protein